MIRRCIALAAALYPRSWRDQFAREFEALLDDVHPSPRVLMNVLGGAIRMQITKGGNGLKLVIATAVLGALAANFAITPGYVSTAVVSIAPQPDPLRPLSPQAFRQRADAQFDRIQANTLSRRSLANLIFQPGLNLYRKERMRLPMDDVEDLMRRSIRIAAVPSKDASDPVAFKISFAYPDRVLAQATSRALVHRMQEANDLVNRDSADTYNMFWRDMTASRLANPAPPPPAGEVLTILDTASVATGPSCLVVVAWGLAAGLLLGVMTALAVRHPRRTWQLGSFALVGCVLAAAASLLITQRYTATAVMQIQPAQITENPLVALPPSRSAAYALQKLQPRVLSDERLSMIIQDPRLNLYPRERKAGSLEDVIRNMREHDLRIAAVNTGSGAVEADNAFSISFTYPDPDKSIDTVNALISRFIRESVEQAREEVPEKNILQVEIVARHAGEYLDVHNPPAVLPSFPQRRTITAAGLVAGLLIGAIALRMRTNAEALRGAPEPA